MLGNVLNSLTPFLIPSMQKKKLHWTYQFGPNPKDFFQFAKPKQAKL
jgi:hypothetical protein